MDWGMKIFDPEITPCPWETVEQKGFRLAWIGPNAEIMELLPGYKQEILAIPELLEVLEIARHVAYGGVYDGHSIDELQKAIENLDETHGEEVGEWLRLYSKCTES